MFGVASLAAYYYMAKDNNPSLDGAISGLAAVQIARKQYLTAAFPTFIETYSSFRDWKEGKFMTAIPQDGNLRRWLLPRIKKSCLSQNGD